MANRVREHFSRERSSAGAIEGGMKDTDLIEHLYSINALTFEEGMDVYKNMRIIRGKVSGLIAHIKLQPKEEASVFLYDPNGQLLPGGGTYDTLREALLTIPLHPETTKIVIKSFSGVWEINRQE